MNCEPDGGYAFLIYFDDTERRPELVFTEAAARERFRRISDSWNAHLFVKIASNTQDEPHANRNAPWPPSQPIASDVVAAPEPHSCEESAREALLDDLEDCRIENIGNSAGYWLSAAIAWIQGEREVDGGTISRQSPVEADTQLPKIAIEPCRLCDGNKCTDACDHKELIRQAADLHQFLDDKGAPRNCEDGWAPEPWSLRGRVEMLLMGRVALVAASPSDTSDDHLRPPGGEHYDDPAYEKFGLTADHICRMWARYVDQTHAPDATMARLIKGVTADVFRAVRSDTSQGVSEAICQSCHGSGEGKCMTWGHGPDDYEVDCPCKDCDGTGIKRDSNSWRQALEFAASTMSRNWPERCQEIVRRARAALRSEPTGEQS